MIVVKFNRNSVNVFTFKYRVTRKKQDIGIFAKSYFAFVNLFENSFQANLREIVCWCQCDAVRITF